MSFLKNLLDKAMGGNTLYYPGCVTHLVKPELEESYKKILQRLGVDFIVIPEFNCCGSPVLRAGYKKDFNELVEKNKKIFEKYGIKRIITNCPGCYNALKNNYGSMRVEHIAQTIKRNIKNIKGTGEKPSQDDDKKITYHDPCHLGRHSNIYDEPRDILKALGYIVEELPRNRERAMCCGGGGGLKANNEAMANNFAKAILSQVKTKRLVSPCPLCYSHFKQNSKGSGITKDIEVVELSELLGELLE